MMRRTFTVLSLSLLVALGMVAYKGNGKDQPAPSEESRFRAKRVRMVEEQLRRRGVKDPRVLSAMESVPRHLFVLPEYAAVAYDDHPLPIGYDQTISQPYIVAVMTEALELEPDDRVLEIGTGSGYQAAILSVLAKSVYTIEIVEPLGTSAAKRLQSLGYDNVEVRVGDGYKGWPEESPFDAIIVTAAPESVPRPLVDQLGDGGRLVIPVGDRFQELFVLQRDGDVVRQKKIANVRFVPMVNDDDD